MGAILEVSFCRVRCISLDLARDLSRLMSGQGSPNDNNSGPNFTSPSDSNDSSTSLLPVIIALPVAFVVCALLIASIAYHRKTDRWPHQALLGYIERSREQKSSRVNQHDRRTDHIAGSSTRTARASDAPSRMSSIRSIMTLPRYKFRASTFEEVVVGNREHDTIIRLPESVDGEPEPQVPHGEDAFWQRNHRIHEARRMRGRGEINYAGIGRSRGDGSRADRIETIGLLSQGAARPMAHDDTIQEEEDVTAQGIDLPDYDIASQPIPTYLDYCGASLEEQDDLSHSIPNNEQRNSAT